MQTTRTPYSVSFMATVLLLFLFACHSTIANAAVALGATRVIYPANQKQVLLPVTNNDPASVYLIQSWIENAGDQKDTQFVITPPLFSIFAFSCNVDGGSSIGAGTTSVYVNLDPVILPGQNLVVDLSQHISCWNDYGGWYDTDHINLVQGSAFAGSLQSYKGSLYWNNVTYPFPLTTNTNVLDIGDKTPMPLPLKLYITPVGAAGGVVIKSGEVIARIHMYKIATLGSGNPRNFTWNIISNNSVVMPTGGCTVDSRNVTVNLPDFPGSAEIPLGVYCSSEQKLSFYLSGATTDSARQVFANTAPDATKASGVGVSLMRNGKTLATGENVSLGTVNKSKVPLGLSATYGQTGNKVAAGAVQSVIGVTFIYE
ncbi:TPA: fimbrial protein [Escherichia coli]